MSPLQTIAVGSGMNTLESHLEALEQALTHLGTGELGVSDFIGLQRRLLAMADTCMSLAQEVLLRERMDGDLGMGSFEGEALDESPREVVASNVVPDLTCHKGVRSTSVRPFALRPLLPVIDYYRIVRTLFGNDESLLMEAERQISQCDSYADAVAYLRASMSWDGAEQEAEGFYSLLHDHYQS